MADTIYAQGFQDGMQAEKAAQNSVIKAMLDSKKIQLESAFKRGKDYGIMASAAQELGPQLQTNVGRLQSDV
ncbi:hypothetical protein ABBQ32_002295 [Trebouxia sp. C0010 RCD-2024]